jgi:hypothetical protein
MKKFEGKKYYGTIPLSDLHVTHFTIVLIKHTVIIFGSMYFA